MLTNRFKTNLSILLLISISGLSGCSVFDRGSDRGVANVDEKLVIPPSLKGSSGPNTVNPKSVQTPTRARPQSSAQKRKTVYKPDGNYYIIVGTYPDQLEALDTFTRLSSIGLKGATMESRRTKAGTLLHMVRLGPYTKQQDIDEAKDSLTNTGMSQFKIVKN